MALPTGLTVDYLATTELQRSNFGLCRDGLDTLEGVRFICEQLTKGPLAERRGCCSGLIGKSSVLFLYEPHHCHFP